MHSKLRTTPIIIFICLITCNFLLLIGNLDFHYASSDQSSLNKVTDEWLDIRSIFSDVGVFIIVGILSFIGFYIRQYFVNNIKWKNDRENFEKNQNYINEKISNAIELMIQDIKTEKEMRSNEIDELRTDFKSVNIRTVQNEERLNGLKDYFIRKNN